LAAVSQAVTAPPINELCQSHDLPIAGSKSVKLDRILTKRSS
jgi:hypothetical protein